MVKPIDFYKKSVSELTDKEIVFIHLCGTSIMLKEFPLHSTIAITMRSVNANLQNIYTRQISPIISLFAILEQLGNIYYNSEIEQSNKTNPIYNCVRNFAGEVQISDKDIDILVALRNGLFHEISYATKSRSLKDKVERYYFFEIKDDTDFFIKHSDQEWDGDLKNVKKEIVTFISRPRFRDFVQNCMNNAESLFEDDKLKLKCKDGADEILYKHLLIHSYSSDLNSFVRSKMNN